MTTLADALTLGRGVERAFKCPVHGDRHASASVNVLKAVWYCYACGAKGTVDGEAAVPSTADLEALLGESSLIPRTYAESWLSMFDAHAPSSYWTERYGRAVASAHRTGTNPVNGGPTYPIRDPDGRLWGVVTRLADAKMKYLYPRGIRISQTLYGAGSSARVLVLVEGASDVMAFDEATIPKGWVVKGCYGAGVHLPQVQIVAAIAPHVVVAAFDDDEAGRAAIKRTTWMLEDVCPVIPHRWLPHGGTDAGSVKTSLRVSGVKETLRKSPFKTLAA